MEKPNYTQVPNIFLDDIMRVISGSATKVLLAICRKTIGWHKDTDSISISQLSEMTGLSNKTVISAIKELGGFVAVDRQDGKCNMYTLNLYPPNYIDNDAPPPKSTQVPPPNLTQVPPPKTTHTKESKDIKEIKISTPTGSTLFQKVQRGFLSHNGWKFTDYKKEGAAINGLIEKARARDSEHAEDLLVSVCAAFWALKQGDNTAKGYWRVQPFLPSRLNSSSIWDGVLETMRNDEVPAEVKALIEGAV